LDYAGAVLLLAFVYGLEPHHTLPVGGSADCRTALSATFVTVILDPKNSQSLAYLVVGGLVGGRFSRRVRPRLSSWPLS